MFYMIFDGKREKFALLRFASLDNDNVFAFRLLRGERVAQSYPFRTLVKFGYFLANGGFPCAERIEKRGEIIEKVVRGRIKKSRSYRDFYIGREVLLCPFFCPVKNL